MLLNIFMYTAVYMNITTVHRGLNVEQGSAVRRTYAAAKGSSMHN